MSVHPFLTYPAEIVPVVTYYSAPVQRAPALRPLTALEQMYAYWGSDRA